MLKIKYQITRRDPIDLSSAEAWDTLKAGAETAWADLKTAVTAAKEKFTKPGEPLN